VKFPKLFIWLTATVVSGLALGSASAQTQRADVAGGIAPPKLVVVVVIDGLPQEQLLKSYDLLVPNGFRRLMDKGAWFSDAHQAHAFTVTAVGHATILSGAYPYQTGIIANDWKSRDGKYIYNTADAAHKYLDGTPTTEDDGVSPKNLQVSLLGDELRYATNNASRIFSVSGKDRGAILMAGKSGTAYMLSKKTGRFTSTSYYMDKHPSWWETYYEKKPQDQWFHKRWNLLLEDPKAYQRALADGQPWAELRLVKDGAILAKAENATRLGTWWVFEAGQHHFWLEGVKTTGGTTNRSETALVVVENFALQPLELPQPKGVGLKSNAP